MLRLNYFGIIAVNINEHISKLKSHFKWWSVAKISLNVEKFKFFVSSAPQIVICRVIGILLKIAVVTMIIKTGLHFSRKITSFKSLLYWVFSILHWEKVQTFGVWRTNEFKVQTQFNLDSIKMILESLASFSINAHYHL